MLPAPQRFFVVNSEQNSQYGIYLSVIHKICQPTETVIKATTNSGKDVKL